MRKIGEFKTAYGPWALVAGASAGLGAAFAKRLAARGMNLVLIARREKELLALADRLTKSHAISVRPLLIDLEANDFLDRLAPMVSDLDIGLLVYNATFPAIGEFLSQQVGNHMRLIDINCRAPVRLVHHFGNGMKKRKRSGIVLMSSLTAFQGTPFIAHYGASKAYILALGEGLAHELKTYGIDLIVSCPGATLTENFLSSIPRDKNISGIPVMQPLDVAELTLNALGTRNVLIPGALNRIASFILRRIMSRKAAVSILKSNAEKLYGH